MKKLIFILALVLHHHASYAALPPLPDFGAKNNNSTEQSSAPAQQPIIQKPEEVATQPKVSEIPQITPPPAAPIEQMESAGKEKLELPDLGGIIDEKDIPKLPETSEAEKKPQLEEEQTTPPQNLLPIQPKAPVIIEEQQPKLEEVPILPSITDKMPVTPPAAENNPPKIETPETPKQEALPIIQPTPIVPPAPIISQENIAPPPPPPAAAQNLLPIQPPKTEAIPPAPIVEVPPPTTTEPKKAEEDKPDSANQIGNAESEEVEKEVNDKDDPSEDLFLKRELKVFTLPNDDVVLGELTKEAEMENMDFPSYARLSQKTIEKEESKEKKAKTEKFIKNSKTKTQKKLDPDSVKMMMDNNPEFSLSFSTDEVNYLTFFATKNGDLELLRLMIDNYYSLDIIDEDGNSLLLIAIINKQEKIVSYLLRKGINPNISNKDNQTALSLAAKNHNHNIIKMLKEAGAFGDIDPQDLEITEDFDVKF
jgi:hypothetical protein